MITIEDEKVYIFISETFFVVFPCACVRVRFMYVWRGVDWCFQALEYKRYSPSSDVWSFAVVVYEIFAFGRKPFFGMKNEEVIRFKLLDTLRNKTVCFKTI